MKVMQQYLKVSGVTHAIATDSCKMLELPFAVTESRDGPLESNRLHNRKNICAGENYFKKIPASDKIML